MHHQKPLRKFGRTSSHRKALFRSLATSLLQHERLETTVEKAKDLRRVVERLITLGREDSLSNRRSAYGYLRSKVVVHKLFAELGPRYMNRPGGYTRVLRTRHRMGDAAAMAVIELVTDEAKKTKKKSGKAKAAKAAKEE